MATETQAQCFLVRRPDITKLVCGNRPDICAHGALAIVAWWWNEIVTGPDVPEWTEKVAVGGDLGAFLARQGCGGNVPPPPLPPGWPGPPPSVEPPPWLTEEMAQCVLNKRPDIRDGVCLRWPDICTKGARVILATYWALVPAGPLTPCSIFGPCQPLHDLLYFVAQNGCLGPAGGGDGTKPSPQPASCSANQMNLLGTCVDQSLILVGGGLLALAILMRRS